MATYSKINCVIGKMSLGGTPNVPFVVPQQLSVYPLYADIKIVHFCIKILQYGCSIFFSYFEIKIFRIKPSGSYVRAHYNHINLNPTKTCGRVGTSKELLYQNDFRQKKIIKKHEQIVDKTVL